MPGPVDFHSVDGRPRTLVGEAVVNALSVPHQHLRTIGGSDVAAIMGVSRYKTAAQVWDRIMGLEVREPEPETGPLPRGRHLEDHAARLWANRTGLAVGHIGEQPHPLHPTIMHGRPDRMIPPQPSNYLGYRNQLGVLECKVLGRWTYRQTLDEGINPEYMLQGQHYLACTGADYLAFAVMNPEDWDIIDPTLLVFPRNHEMIFDINNKVCEWWHTYVVPGIRPPDAFTQVSQYVRAVGGVEEMDWTSNIEFNTACQALMEAREASDLAVHRLGLAEERVKTMLGEAQVVRGIHGRVTFKEATRTTFDKAAYLQENPNVDLSPWSRSTVYRTLRYTGLQ